MRWQSNFLLRYVLLFIVLGNMFGGRIPKKRMRIRCVFWGQVARVVEFSFLILMFSGGQSQPS